MVKGKLPEGNDPLMLGYDVTWATCVIFLGHLLICQCLEKAWESMLTSYKISLFGPFWVFIFGPFWDNIAYELAFQTSKSYWTDNIELLV